MSVFEAEMTAYPDSFIVMGALLPIDPSVIVV